MCNLPLPLFLYSRHQLRNISRFLSLSCINSVLVFSNPGLQQLKGACTKDAFLSLYHFCGGHKYFLGHFVHTHMANHKQKAKRGQLGSVAQVPFLALLGF